ncbi:substrate-binding periplasmic protein [Marinobacter sp. JSM 1782161]|uniref:substrate-binding periplasmic protein n=1 Tax=Marinobacter sp. JSM 1782161 TaxID=2685906 RepID=UPI0014031F4E|nr:transporter substrate-binding domain-containing protein [Marinobacter sp. JSM 1782161]
MFKFSSARCLILALVVWGSGGTVRAEVLELVTEPWPPLVEQRDGKPTGPLWTVAQAVLTRMGYEPRLRFVPWKRALDLVARNEADAVLGAGMTVERRQLFLYPAEPLAYSETVLFSDRRSSLVYEDFDSLEGLTIGLSAGYSYTRDVWSAPQFEREEVRDIRAGLNMVLLGRVDAFMVNRAVGWHEAHRLGIADQLSASVKPISEGSVYLMFAPTTDPELVHAFDRAIRRFRGSKEYVRLMRDYAAPHPDEASTPDS